MAQSGFIQRSTMAQMQARLSIPRREFDTRAVEFSKSSSHDLLINAAWCCAHHVVAASPLACGNSLRCSILIAHCQICHTRVTCCML